MRSRHTAGALLASPLLLVLLLAFVAPVLLMVPPKAMKWMRGSAMG